MADQIAQMIADQEGRRRESQRLAKLTPEQRTEEGRQKNLRKLASKLPFGGTVDEVAQERAEKAAITRREGKVLPSQVIVNAPRPQQPGENLE